MGEVGLNVDEFIGWQQDLGRAQATIRRRLIALRMFYDYLAYICEEGVTNPVVTQRHYIDQGHRLPRDIRQNEIEKLFTAIGDHLRDRTIFTLMLHTGIRVGEVVNLRLAEAKRIKTSRRSRQMPQKMRPSRYPWTDGQIDCTEHEGERIEHDKSSH